MKYRIKTITRILPADLQTPVGIYLKVRDLFPQSALLESSDYHTTQNSFSFMYHFYYSFGTKISLRRI